ncbi:MAG: hypothetical protein WC841_00550 [Candidatus Shapirobacteria bacterium]|jgi:formate-dependent nitrite reductase membrane component NrfD
MDVTQIIIIVSIISVSVVIIVCGVWVALILKELKSTVIKTNSILDDTKLITSSVAQPVSTISEFLSGFKSGINLLNSFFKKKEKALKNDQA